VGPAIHADGVVISGGGTLAFVDVDVFSEDGRVSAKARATMRVFSRDLAEPALRPEENGKL
jgi:acyl-coenzyme A thioesterase PaaI-like protein